MYYKCNNFMLQELVDQKTYNRFGESAWRFFNPCALKTLDDIRDYFGVKITVNTWLWGGNLQFRGFRPKWTSVGGEYSLHRLGAAFDYDVENKTAEEVREEILKHKTKEPFSRISALELDVNWVHMDFRNIPNDIRILLISP